MEPAEAQQRSADSPVVAVEVGNRDPQAHAAGAVAVAAEAGAVAALAAEAGAVEVEEVSVAEDEDRTGIGSGNLHQATTKYVRGEPQC